MTTIAYRDGILAADRQVVSGHMCAGQMTMGATAERAVEISGQLDLYSGSGIDILHLALADEAASAEEVSDG